MVFRIILKTQYVFICRTQRNICSQSHINPNQSVLLQSNYKRVTQNLKSLDIYLATCIAVVHTCDKELLRESAAIKGGNLLL